MVIPCFFRRDYISKKKETSSIYTAIIKFIRDAGRSVSKNEIKTEFPAIPEIVLYSACSDNDIIIGFASYTHIDIIRQKEDEIEKLESILEKMVSEDDIQNSEDLLIVLKKSHQDLIDAFEIDNRYKLFSVIKALFSDRYEMQRPFFARKGKYIGKQEERIIEFLSNYEEISIDELMDFINENNFHYYSKIERINSLEDFVFKNHDEIIRYSKTGISKEMILNINDFIDNIIGTDDFVLASKIDRYDILPKINIEWNEWVIYSIINKWSTKYLVITSNNQLRAAEPLIIKKDLNVLTFEELIKIEQKKQIDVIELIS